MPQATLSDAFLETHFELNDRGFTTLVEGHPKEYRLADVIGIRVCFQGPTPGTSPIDRLYLRVQDPTAPLIEVRPTSSGMNEARLAKLLEQTSAQIAERVFGKLRDDQSFYNNSWVMSPSSLLDRTTQTETPIDLIGGVAWDGCYLAIHRLDTDQPLVLYDVAEENTWVLAQVLRQIVDHGMPKTEPVLLAQPQVVPHVAAAATVAEPISAVPDRPGQTATATRIPNPTTATPETAPLAFSQSISAKCKVNVKSEPTHFAKGVFDCEVSAAGLRLTKRHEIITIPRGQEIHYAGDNRIVVEYPDHRLHLTVQKLWSYQDQLARDIVAFMNGEAEAPREGDYALPFYLGACASLPIGIPIMTLGGAIPAVVGFALSAACFAVARKTSLPESVRLMLILAMAAGGYLVTLACLGAIAV